MNKTKIINDLANRTTTLLEGTGEVELAIEGRFTNIRIWRSKNNNTIYMRLDKANNYSATLCDESLTYLDKNHPPITKLNELFGFNNATINDIETIIEITKDMKSRPCIEW